MLQRGYIVGEINHIFAVRKRLARLLHCLCESVACQMTHLLLVIRDWVRSDSAAGLKPEQLPPAMQLTMGR